MAVIVSALVVCAACGTQAAEQPGSSSTMPVMTSSVASSVAPTMMSSACGTGGCEHPPGTFITSNEVIGTMGQSVPARWQTGLGTVTLNSASWAGPELVSQSDSVAGGGSGNGTYLVLSVTYESTTGIVPIRWYSWTAQGKSDDDSWTPIDTYPPEAMEAREPPWFQLEVPAGQRRDTTLVFDMQFEPVVNVQLVDSDGSGMYVDLLATWTVVTDQVTHPATATPTS